MNETVETKPKKKKSGIIKYVVYMLIVLIATAVSLGISLWGNWDSTVNAFSKADWKILLLILGIVAFTYVLEGLVILVFCRLYTRKYKFHQGLASSLIGQFYSDVTPGASGGQVMQAYTLKQQGIQVSNAASIMVMWFILWQSALIIFDVVAFIVKFDQISSIGSITIGEWVVPMWPLIIIGFIVNLSVIFLLLLMSNSHKFHNFILRYVIGFLGKIKLIRNPDKTRESLRVQVENFKIELRRLSANIPVVILQLIFFFLIIFLRASIPYWAGLALNAYETTSFDFVRMTDAAFTSSFQQMITGLMPLPGSAGVSEVFYSILFNGFFHGDGGLVTATQIIWRTSTFHIVLLISGLFSAFYKSRPTEQITEANRATFVTLQYETYAERKLSSDTMYETSQMNRKELLKKINKAKEEPESNASENKAEKQSKKEKPKPAPKQKKEKPAKVDKSDWGRIDI